MTIAKKLAISLIWMMARVSRNFVIAPPSPALAVDFDGVPNPCNSGQDANLHRCQLKRFLRRHGAAIHFVAHNSLRVCKYKPRNPERRAAAGSTAFRHVM
jgi:hypothetical protein